MIKPTFAQWGKLKSSFQMSATKLKAMAAMISTTDQILDDVSGLENWIGHEVMTEEQLNLHRRIDRLTKYQVHYSHFIPKAKKLRTGRPRVPKGHFKKMAERILVDAFPRPNKNIGSLNRQDTWLIQQIEFYNERHDNYSSRKSFLIAVAERRGIYPFPKWYKTMKRLEGKRK